MFAYAKLAFLSSCALAAVASAAPNVHRQNDLPPPFGGFHIGNGALSRHSSCRRNNFRAYIATTLEPGGTGACGSIIDADEFGVGVSLELFNTFP